MAACKNVNVFTLFVNHNEHFHEQEYMNVHVKKNHSKNMHHMSLKNYRDANFISGRSNY